MPVACESVAMMLYFESLVAMLCHEGLCPESEIYSWNERHGENMLYSESEIFFALSEGC